MPDFKPGDVVRLRHPENWPHTTRHHGYLWVVTHQNISVVGVKSVANGRSQAFETRDLKGADDE